MKPRYMMLAWRLYEDQNGTLVQLTSLSEICDRLNEYERQLAEVTKEIDWEGLTYEQFLQQYNAAMDERDWQTCDFLCDENPALARRMEAEG
jgi:hypothetical protein